MAGQKREINNLKAKGQVCTDISPVGHVPTAPHWAGESHWETRTGAKLAELSAQQEDEDLPGPTFQQPDKGNSNMLTVEGYAKVLTQAKWSQKSLRKGGGENQVKLEPRDEKEGSLTPTDWGSKGELKEPWEPGGQLTERPSCAQRLK